MHRNDPDAFRLADEVSSVKFLYSNAEILSAIERSDQRRDNLNRELRYQLLTAGLELNSHRAPELFDVLNYLKECFGITAQLEIYVSPADGSSASVLKLEQDTYIVHISKRVFEILDLDEITFVLGHELAHVAFQHFDLIHIDTEKLPSRLARVLHQTRRYGEVSADLAAASVTKDPASGRRALAKLAAGGLHQLIDLSIEADKAQVGKIHEILEEDKSLFEITCSHPASVLRMLILGLFERQKRGQSDRKSLLAELHDEVNQLVEISFPQPSDQDEWLTIVAAFWVAFADDDINFKERREVAKLCSEGEFRELYDLCLEQDSPSVFMAQQFAESLQNLSLSKSKRAMLLEKIVLIARADGEVSDLEHQVLSEVCNQLGLDTAFLERLLRLP